MKLQTKYFGEINYDEKDCLSFPAGLFGFEEEHSFLLLPFHGSENTLLCLQSIQTPALAFVAVDPFTLNPGYIPEPSPAQLESLGVKKAEELSYYTLCVVRNPVADSTVNLKCPVAVNPETRMARQLILETGNYDMRHPLAEFRRKEGNVC
ncbi:MAG: flagellar assembly protein FliW [Acutalibacter sp.]